MTGEGLASPPGSLELTGPPVSGRHRGGWSGGAGIRDEVSLTAVPPVVRSSPFAANSGFGAFTGRRSGRTDATD